MRTNDETRRLTMMAANHRTASDGTLFRAQCSPPSGCPAVSQDHLMNLVSLVEKEART
jgi:hypothetical protein